MFLGVPWNPRGLRADDDRVATRKRYITKIVVDVHGATEGCAGCSGKSNVHNTRCKKCFETIFQREAAQENQQGPGAQVVEGVAKASSPQPATAMRPRSQLLESAPGGAGGATYGRGAIHAAARAGARRGHAS